MPSNFVHYSRTNTINHTYVNIINVGARDTYICQGHHILTDVIDAIPYTLHSCH